MSDARDDPDDNVHHKAFKAITYQPGQQTFKPAAIWTR